MVGSRRSSLVPAIILSMTLTAWCQSFDGPAASLAGKIAALLPKREAVTLSFRNLSSMPSADASAARVVLERELRTQGLTVRAQAGVEVAVTISENARGYLWVAEIRRAEAREVVMEQAAIPHEAAATAAVITIEKRLLFEQDERILDFSPAGAMAMVVLDAAGVSLHEGAQTPRVPIARSWPRDLRGRLVVQGGTYQAYLPGAKCNGVIVSGLSVTCIDGILWPLASGVQAT